MKKIPTKKLRPNKRNPRAKKLDDQAFDGKVTFRMKKPNVVLEQAVFEPRMHDAERRFVVRVEDRHVTLASSTEYFDQVVEVGASSVQVAFARIKGLLDPLQHGRGFGSCTVIVGLRRP